MISYMISFTILDLISHMILQVEDAEKALKTKIRPRNAFLSCYKLNFLAAMPREEFLIGLYGGHIIPSVFWQLRYAHYVWFAFSVCWHNSFGGFASR